MTLSTVAGLHAYILSVYTDNMVSKRKRTRPRSHGPRKRYTRRIVLPLQAGVAERLDLLRRDNESRLDLIREGIERVLSERDK